MQRQKKKQCQYQDAFVDFEIHYQTVGPTEYANSKSCTLFIGNLQPYTFFMPKDITTDIC